MTISGHGVDIVSIARIEQMLREHPDRFVERCFTPAEREYCQPRKNAAQHFAARFAAKEAVLKALGKGLADGIAWTDVEVRRDPSGRPTIRLHGRASLIALDQGVTAFHLSLSHTDTDAIASVITERAK